MILRSWPLGFHFRISSVKTDLLHFLIRSSSCPWQSGDHLQHLLLRCHLRALILRGDFSECLECPCLRLPGLLVLMTDLFASPLFCLNRSLVFVLQHIYLHSFTFSTNICQSGLLQVEYYFVFAFQNCPDHWHSAPPCLASTSSSCLVWKRDQIHPC